VASINANGLAAALNTGTTTLTASSGGISGSAAVTVVPVLVSIAITPQSLSVPQGTVQQLAATGAFSDGSTADLTKSVNWFSSKTFVAAVSSSGAASAFSQGTTSITASFKGIISPSVTLTVTPPVPVSVAIVLQNPALPVGLSKLLRLIGTYANGSTQDLSTFALWNSSAPSTATVSTLGLATGVSQGPATISASYATVSASLALNVTAPSLITAVVSPQNPVLPVGTAQQFTIMGTYSDGSTRDITSSVAWSAFNPNVASIGANGVATPLSPGSTSIIATSGNLVFSTALTVSHSGPPTITVSALPSPSAAGWNNTNVTVTFTCTPGSAVITSCPPAQVISTDGTNQVISGAVTDASGNTASTSVTLNIDKTPPALVVSAPVDGGTFTDVTITATGTLSDSLSGLSSLTCNGTPVTISGSSFSCNISLNPGVNLVVVRATDIAGNVALTKERVTLNAVLPAPASLQVTPASATMVVGETQQFAAVDEQGRTRTDATWTVSDATLAAISTNSPLALSAVAPGRVTLTATVQGITAQVQVNLMASALNPGTSRWNNPPLPGLRTQDAFAAVPFGGSVPDIYSYESGNASLTQPFTQPTALRAFTTDGRLLWQVQGSDIPFQGYVPDAFGGLAYNSDQGLIDLDAQTGQPVWKFNKELGQMAVRPNGDIVGINCETNNSNECARKFINVIDGNTGQQILRMPLRQNSFTLNNASMLLIQFNLNLATDCPGDPNATVTTYQPPDTQQITIDESGNIYLIYSINSTTDTISFSTCGNPATFTHVNSFKSSVVLAQISSDNSYSEHVLKSDDLEISTTQTSFISGGSVIQVLQSDTQHSGSLTFADLVIPDGQGGALGVWVERADPETDPNFDSVRQTMVTHIAPGGNTTYSLPIEGPDDLLLGEDGTAFAVVSTKPFHVRDATSPFTAALLFDVNSGQTAWSYQAAFDEEFLPVSSSAGNGLAARVIPPGGPDKILQFDSTGNSTLIWSAFSNLVTYTIGDHWLTSDPFTGALTVASATAITSPATFWFRPTGGMAPTNASETKFPPLDHCTSSLGCIGHHEAIYNALDDLILRLQDPTIATLAQTEIFNKIGKDANGFRITTQSFIRYLTSKRPEIYNGLISNYCYDAMVPGLFGPSNICNHFPISILGRTVQQFFRFNKGTNAVTHTPHYPLLIFFDPTTIAFDNLGANLQSEGTLLHEALHGMTGLDDSQLESLLGVTGASCMISQQIRDNVLSHSPGIVDVAEASRNPCP